MEDGLSKLRGIWVRRPSKKKAWGGQISRLVCLDLGVEKQVWVEGGRDGSGRGDRAPLGWNGQMWPDCEGSTCLHHHNPGMRV